MQLIIKNSKYLLLALLSCSFFITCVTGNMEVPSVGFADQAINKPYDSVWNSMRRDFVLDHKPQSAEVKAEIHKLLADQGKLYNVLSAAGPYIYFIYNQTQSRGLPAELALIPAIESEFNPNDHSSKKGARGLWQLMTGTANELGVKVKSGYDGRRNVVDSTNAALAYFKDLGNLFDGNWYLAIAAYDCGQGKIRSAVKKGGTHNFWNLRLPKETKDYVPKLLAVAEIVKHPEKYGVQLPPVSNQPYFSELKVSKPVSLVKVAKASGINVETLNVLNPDYKSGIAAKKGDFHLLVPVSKERAVKQQLAGSIIT